MDSPDISQMSPGAPLPSLGQDYLPDTSWATDPAWDELHETLLAAGQGEYGATGCSPPSPTSPLLGAVRGQHPTCSPSPVAAPPRPTTPPSLRERLHHLILQHQQPRNLAAGRGNTPPPPYSNLQDSAPSSLTREALPQTSRPIRPTRARRRAQGPGSPAGAAPRRMSRTPSSPPPLVSRRSEGVGSTSDQSS